VEQPYRLSGDMGIAGGWTVGGLEIGGACVGLPVTEEDRGTTAKFEEDAHNVSSIG
jgi:hypothetical protein